MRRNRWHKNKSSKYQISQVFEIKATKSSPCSPSPLCAASPPVQRTPIPTSKSSLPNIPNSRAPHNLLNMWCHQPRLARRHERRPKSQGSLLETALHLVLHLLLSLRFWCRHSLVVFPSPRALNFLRCADGAVMRVRAWLLGLSIRRTEEVYSLEMKDCLVAAGVLLLNWYWGHKCIELGTVLAVSFSGFIW
jgi:hypothetical protein